jgi:dUTP pyrophosphatase
VKDSNQSALIVELLHDDARPPKRATSGSAGYDLFAYLNHRAIRCSDGRRMWEVAGNQSPACFDLEPGCMALIPLGFKARLPDGFEAQVRPRSGTTFKKGLDIPNAPGTIDADYPEEWMVIVRNPGSEVIRIDHGERIAQMVLSRFEVLPIEHGPVGIVTERLGGFGSTGG